MKLIVLVFQLYCDRHIIIIIIIIIIINIIIIIIIIITNTLSRKNSK